MNRIGNYNFIVVNRPGAGGIVAASALARSRPDELTLMLAVTAQLIQPLQPAATSTVREAYAGVRYAMLIGGQDSYLVVSGASGIRGVEDLREAHRARGSALAFGSLGVGSAGHLQGIAVARDLGIDAIHVPYNGSAAVLQGILNGDIHYALLAHESFRARLSGDVVRPLAVASTERSVALPAIPTAPSLGLPSIDRGTWFALTHAAQSEPAGVARFVEDLAVIYSEPDRLRPILDLGVQPRMLTGPRLEQFLAEERRYWSRRLEDLPV
jgi:tripartite-type tricarboxylate transporter receptor subunit TctC